MYIIIIITDDGVESPLVSDELNGWRPLTTHFVRRAF